MNDQNVTVTLPVGTQGYRYKDQFGNVYRMWSKTEGPKWAMHGPEGYQEFKSLQEIREALGHEADS